MSARSLLEYSCPLLDPYRQNDIDKLSKIQKADEFFVTNSYQRKSNSTALIQEGCDPRLVASTAAFHAKTLGSFPGLGGVKETKMFLLNPRVKLSIVGSLCDREVACSASDLQGLHFESCGWRAVSSHSSHHPQEVLLAQFILYVHKSGLKPDSFHLISCSRSMLD